MIAFIEAFRKSTKKTNNLELIHEFSKVKGFKINIQKSVVLYLTATHGYQNLKYNTIYFKHEILQCKYNKICIGLYAKTINCY